MVVLGVRATGTILLAMAGCDEDPEDIIIDVWSYRVFVAVIFLPVCPCFHCLPLLLGRLLAGSDKLIETKRLIAIEVRHKVE